YVVEALFLDADLDGGACTGRLCPVASTAFGRAGPSSRRTLDRARLARAAGARGAGVAGGPGKAGGSEVRRLGGRWRRATGVDREATQRRRLARGLDLDELVLVAHPRPCGRVDVGVAAATRVERGGEQLGVDRDELLDAVAAPLQEEADGAGLGRGLP